MLSPDLVIICVLVRRRSRLPRSSLSRRAGRTRASGSQSGFVDCLLHVSGVAVSQFFNALNLLRSPIRLYFFEGTLMRYSDPALLQYGHAMWVKYNKDPSFKRNIRHDDAELTFCLDMKLPKRQDWITVPYSRALADRNQNSKKLIQDNDGLLSSAGELVTVESEQADGMEPAPSTPGGTVTSYSWRAPKKA